MKKLMTPLVIIVALMSACGGGKNSEKDDCALSALGNLALNLPNYFDFVGSDLSDFTTKGMDKAQEEFESAIQANEDRYRSSLVTCGLSDSEVEEKLQQITE